ncbi:hypothetical protein [Paracoccus laeviglucosivorans]|uniref:Uncharacterized protein n=1 Tax=Paracoccus laeviglucosivorans TaxID=1197861 RepID=A0A521FUM7_9RHOB|nr:hypothetical protein [Paracoccus laeviglucosivorans]SMO99925.1 hypothetical protein SAMN06265221_1523 [Paracoccus laeviglucosivorans]
MNATRDEATFTLTGHYWSSTYPTADLPNWLAFYQRQQDLTPKSAHHYGDTVLKLENLQLS